MANKIVDDERGLRIEIVDPPTSEDAEHIRKYGVRTAWIKGFGMAPLPDLALFDGLIDDLNVVTLNLRSDESVTGLPRLTDLALQTYARNRIDFRVFASLRSLVFYWRPGADTALELSALRRLAIWNYPYADLSPLHRQAELRSLTLNTARIESLAGIDALPNLQSLFLGADRRLVDLTALAGQAPRLRGLDISYSRSLRDIGALRAQTDLEELALTDCGRIESLAPLAPLRRLKRLWLYGTTVIEDGDLSVLLELPNLHGAAFANRRHYSHRAEEVEAELERRHGPYVVSPGHTWLA